MKPESIFQPVFALVVLTFLVLTRLALLRVGAVARKEVQAKQYKYYEAGKEPPRLIFTSRNFINLFESPVLFYVVTILFYITLKVDGLVVGLAWAFVTLRAVHSGIHVTINHVWSRFAVFLLSILVLMALWGILFIRLYF